MRYKNQQARGIILEVREGKYKRKSKKCGQVKFEECGQVKFEENLSIHEVYLRALDNYQFLKSLSTRKVYPRVLDNSQFLNSLSKEGRWSVWCYLQQIPRPLNPFTKEERLRLWVDGNL